MRLCATTPWPGGQELYDAKEFTSFTRRLVHALSEFTRAAGRVVVISNGAANVFD